MPLQLAFAVLRLFVQLLCVDYKKYFLLLIIKNMESYLKLLIKFFDIPDSLAELIIQKYDDDLIMRCIRYTNEPYLQELSIYSWITATALS